MRGLYIHIPFCLAKCKYCNFNSGSFSKNEQALYLSALFREMEKYKNEEVDTVFIGGGTPTSLCDDHLLALLENINKNFVISKNAEFTVEANPKTLTENNLLLMKKYGVNRLSVGVQSFNDNELLSLGRIHTKKDAKDTIKMAQKCGFSKINIDLNSANPNQSKKSFINSLNEAISLGTTHISCYSLILEEGTPLFEENEKGQLLLLAEDEEREIYEAACKILEENGYMQYEISNFARKGFESRHNIKYWTCNEYIGLGLSAHSYIGGVRFSNTDDFLAYTNGEFSTGASDVLSKNDKMSEFVFLGLRMTRGIEKAEFKKRFDVEIEKIFEKELLKYKNMGMIIENNGFLALSHSALSVSNAILCDFIL